MAWHHKANSGEKGWGDQWQSALWAAQGAEAAWFLWDKLSEQTRNLVLKMLIHEADRFIGYQVPYYQDKEGRIVTPGDTKSRGKCLELQHPDHCLRYVATASAFPAMV